MKKLSLFLVALAMVLVSCKPEQPKVVTTEVTEITVNTAVCGGEVVSGGDAVVVARGVCWNTAEKSENTETQHRLFNPNAISGTHHYTASEEERTMLIEAGWIYEGVGWYSMKNN